MKSNDDSLNSEKFVFPSPGEPLRFWKAEHFPPKEIVGVTEALLKIVDLGPSFEADRLATKCRECFRI